MEAEEGGLVAAAAVAVAAVAAAAAAAAAVVVVVVVVVVVASATACMGFAVVLMCSERSHFHEKNFEFHYLHTMKTRERRRSGFAIEESHGDHWVRRVVYVSGENVWRKEGVRKRAACFPLERKK